MPESRAASTFTFTVLTATYNRAHTLRSVYDCLVAQTFRDFEWLIIDDGSTDDTRELVASWPEAFPVRYHWQRNGGKHAAMNAGVRQALGKFIVPLDSDDICVPHTMETFNRRWLEIPDPSRYAALVCLCCTPSGELVGKPFEKDPVDSFSFPVFWRLADNTEHWAMLRTDVLREFPYPEGEKYVMESLVWNRIAHCYAIRYVNEPLRIYTPSPGGITERGKELLISSPRATRTYFKELAISRIPPLQRAKAALNLCRFGMLSLFAKLRRDAGA